jgi:hypothetical protein
MKKGTVVHLHDEVFRTWSMWDAQNFFLLMVADGCIARLKDSIHFYRCLDMTGVSLGSYISKPFSPITTSSHDILMKMLSVMSKHISPIATSSHGIVMKMLSVICQSLSPPLQLVVTVLSWKCCQLYVNAFLLRYNW